MSYEEMARSHIKELVREAFELDEVVVDGDGDLPFPCGTALFYVSVIHGGRLLRAWSPAASGLHVNKAVLRELNEANAGLRLARVYARADDLYVEGCLPVESLRAEDIRALCFEVGQAADRIGSMLAAVHGGRVTFPDAHAVGRERDAEVEDDT